MKARLVGVWTAMLVVAAGCAGHRFTRPHPETLVLGKTTYEEVARQVGEPVRTDTVLENGHPLKASSYLCAGFCAAGERTGEFGLQASSAMDFFFLDDILVGYHYTSTRSNEKTDFDDARAYQLKKGQTTRSQAIELLGRPSGMYIYPMISRKTDTALVWLYVGVKAEIAPRSLLTRRPGVKTSVKRLVVSFDSQHLVTEAEFGAGGVR